MTTKKAYTEMINRKGIELVLGVGIGYIYVHRNEVAKGKFPSLEKMESRLKLAGYHIMWETTWLNETEPADALKAIEKQANFLEKFLNLINEGVKPLVALKQINKKK